MLNIEIKNLDEFLNKVSKINIQRTLNIGVKKSIIFLEGAAKKETPVDTGLLRNSYETFFESLKGKLVNTRKYGLYVHEGTRYIKGNPFLTRAAKKSNKDINIIFSNEVHKTLNSLKT